MSKRHDPPSGEHDFEWVLGAVDRNRAREPTPQHWDALMREVTIAAATKVADPSHPLHEIGRFEAIATRGIGGFGIVFEVRDPALDRHVALKLCQTRGPKAAEGLMAEAKLLARLSHPNIVTVHEPGRHGDDVFFVMEYVNGVNAQRFADREPAPSWEQIVDVYRGAGRGLAAAHDAGIVHGDFKPVNVLLDERDQPRVADFGLAQVMLEHASDAERQGLRHRAGTLPFMAPEVLRGQAGDVLSDQWSFCVSLWQGLERALPFDGWTAAELLDDIERGAPWAMNPDVPEAVRAIVRVGLSKDPGDRYPDMHALVRALDDVRQPPRAAASGGSWDGWRGAFFVAVLLLGVTVFAALSLRHDVQSGRAASKAIAPTPSPASGCALPGSAGFVVEIDRSVRGICILIREGAVEEANALWDREHANRERLTGEAVRSARMWTELAAQTLVVARTLVEQAEAVQATDPAAADSAAHAAINWTVQASRDLVLSEATSDALESRLEASSAAIAALELEIADVEGRAAEVIQRTGK